MNSQINIHIFQGILGDVVNSSVQQNLQMGIAAKDVEGLLAHLRAQNVADADLAELKSRDRGGPAAYVEGGVWQPSERLDRKDGGSRGVRQLERGPCGRRQLAVYGNCCVLRAAHLASLPRLGEPQQVVGH